jgi:hypothetical protein
MQLKKVKIPKNEDLIKAKWWFRVAEGLGDL